MLNLSLILEESAKKYPNKTACICGEARFSYHQVNTAANKVANGLQAIGIKPGDKVALSCPNIPQFLFLYYGIIKTGAIVVPLSILLSKEEIAYQLQDCDAKAYFCFTGTPELPIGKMGSAACKENAACSHFFLIMPSPNIPTSIEGVQTFDDLLRGTSGQFVTYQSSAEDTCIIIYTSGTTGHPKGAELTHANLFLNALVSVNLYSAQMEDVVLAVLPLFHIFGMTVTLNAAIYKAMTVVLVSRFDAEAVFNAMQTHKATVFAGVPTMYWGLLHYNQPKFDYATISQNLRHCVSGGASMPVQVLHDFEQRFGVMILEGYGMSEGSPVVTFNQKDTGRKAGSIGTPVWGVEVKLVDTDGKEVAAGEKGELLYRGHNVMKGYYNKPEDTARALQNGWLHSGDIAVRDEDGFYFIVDRLKDMIIRGGMKVYPRELEEVLIKHEAVSLVAVVGQPHEQFGEEVKAFVVLKEGKTASESELIAYAKEHVASYKYPRSIEFVPALPMTATGKILKKELRRQGPL